MFFYTAVSVLWQIKNKISKSPIPLNGCHESRLRGQTRPDWKTRQGITKSRKTWNKPYTNPSSLCNLVGLSSFLRPISVCWFDLIPFSSVEKRTILYHERINHQASCVLWNIGVVTIIHLLMIFPCTHFIILLRNSANLIWDGCTIFYPFNLSLVISLWTLFAAISFFT